MGKKERNLVADPVNVGAPFSGIYRCSSCGKTIRGWKRGHPLRYCACLAGELMFFVEDNIEDPTCSLIVEVGCKSFFIIMDQFPEVGLILNLWRGDTLWEGLYEITKVTGDDPLRISVKRIGEMDDSMPVHKVREA